MITLTLTAQLASLIPLVLGVVQVFKTMGLSEKLSPLVALLLGVTATVSLTQNVDAMTILGGIVVGLAASGLWSGAKNVSEEVITMFRK